jgi:hypothetical protein
MKSKALRLYTWGENQKRAKQHFEKSAELAGATGVAVTVGCGPCPNFNRKLPTRLQHQHRLDHNRPTCSYKVLHPLNNHR